MAVVGSPSKTSPGLEKLAGPKMKLLQKDVVGVHPHDNYHMVINLSCDDWEIKRLLIDQGSSTNILY